MLEDNAAPPSPPFNGMRLTHLFCDFPESKEWKCYEVHWVISGDILQVPKKCFSVLSFLQGIVGVTRIQMYSAQVGIQESNKTQITLFGLSQRESNYGCVGFWGLLKNEITF